MLACLALTNGFVLIRIKLIFAGTGVPIAADGTGKALGDDRPHDMIVRARIVTFTEQRSGDGSQCGFCLSCAPVRSLAAMALRWMFIRTTHGHQRPGILINILDMEFNTALTARQHQRTQWASTMEIMQFHPAFFTCCWRRYRTFR